MKKILIIEDKTTLSAELLYKQKELGTEVFAVHGNIDIGEIKTLAPDLVIFDKWTSGDFVINLSCELKVVPETKGISTIVLTDSQSVARVAAESCCDAYLEKPYRFAELLMLIDKFLH